MSIGPREHRDTGPRCFSVTRFKQNGASFSAAADDSTCVEIKISRRVRKPSRRPPRHRRDACTLDSHTGQHQRQHDARRARQQAGRAINARPQPGERRMESLRLELPVPATEGQRHRCRVACAFDEAEERLEPGNEIVHVIIRKSKPGRVCSWKAARKARNRRVRLAARARPELPPGQLATITSMPSQFVHSDDTKGASGDGAHRSHASSPKSPHSSTTATIGCSKRAP